MTIGETHLNLLLQANRILSSTLDEKDVLVRIMELANEVVGAEAASILLIDPRTNELVFDVALGEKGDQVKEVRLKPGEGIAGWVALNKKSLIVNDVSNDPRWTSRVDQQADFSTRGVLAAPLLFKGRLLGVIEVINKSDNAAFSEDDLQILEAFSAQAAISIETAHLFSQLKAEKEKLDLVFSQMSDAAVYAGPDLNIILANDSFKKLTGKTSGSVPGALADFKSNPPIETLVSGGENTSRLELSHKKKQLYFSGWLSRIAGAGGSVDGYLVTLRDTTEEKKEQLLKRTFLSLVSHKLRTPLVSIIGYSDILLKKLSSLSEKLEGKDKPAIEVINRQGQYLNSLVEKLLNFVTIERSEKMLEKKQNVVSEMVNEAAEAVKGLYEKAGAAFTVDSSIDSLGAVPCDRDMIKLVLVNLLENAVKFNDSPQKKVRVSGFEKDGCAGVSVEDNGSGIPAGQREKIFEEFYQAEEYFTGQVKGIGLGLALSRMIVRAHGGDIGFESGPEGSKFHFTLPKGGA
jgi:two-component system, NtrC family, sensor histidine kinase KinB